MNPKEFKELIQAIERNQSCLHCGKQGHHHTSCLKKFVQEMYGKKENT